MFEICMKNKIIFDFFKNFKQKKWNNIINSLLEIAILNLYTSFKRYIFSEEDLYLIIENLKLKYNFPLSNERNFKAKKIVKNNNKETIDIDIPKFRKNLKLHLHEYINGRKDSYRSYTKNAKNINELNIYSNHEKKKIHYYNKSGEVTPIKALINYNETDVSQAESKYKNIFKINKLNKRHKKDNIKSINIGGKDKKVIDYNTVDHSDCVNNTYESIFNICKNFNQNMNYSFSIDYNKNKRYIKVNKNSSNKKLIDNNYNNNNINDKGYMKKDNYFYLKNNKDINSKTFKINKILKYKMINYNKKFKNGNNLLTNFNQKQILKQDKNKIKLNLNNINYYKEKIPPKYISQTANNSLSHNSPNKKYHELACLIKLRKNKNKNNSIINNINNINNNNNSLNINNNNLKELKSIQFSNIKKNFKDINLRNIFSKERKTEINSNKEIIDDINNTISNVNDINISYSKCNNNYFKKGLGTINKNYNKKTNINYNSFNNSNNNIKKAIFLNDPLLFIKRQGEKKFLLNKKNISINANGNDNNS